MVDARALGDLMTEVGIDAVMDDLIDRLERAFVEHDADQTVTMVRDGFHYEKPDLGLIEWMPTLQVGRRAAIKTVGYHPSNPVQRHLPSVLATTSVYDTESGVLLGLVESTVLTALRTGAASAVATKHLATDGPVTLGMIGCGAQSVSQIHALSRVREIERLLVADAHAEVAESLAARVAFTGLVPEVVPADGRPEMVAACDVLCTATSIDIGAPPLFEADDLRPGLHVNAVGADFAGKLELPRALVRQSLVVPDVLEQCLVEGECQHLDPSDVGPSLADLLADDLLERDRRSGQTVFDSTGWALEDLVAADLVLELAEATGRGHLLQLQAIPSDPYDPYELVR